jgi:DNA invertase Pin-like site-specific DNA recombinase
MKNVVIYCRVSTDEQATGHSLDYQQEALIRFSESKEYNIKQIFREDHSAKDFNRPQWQKIQKLVKENHKKSSKIDAIVMLRPDRYSRNLLLSLTEKIHLEKSKCEIEFIEGQVDVENPAAILLNAINYSIPQMENEKISRRSKEGSHTARKKGCWTGQAPKGYKNIRIDNNSTLELGPDAGLIAEAFEKMASGLYSANQIRLWLNTKGMKLSKNMFPNIIRNVAYTGKILVKSYQNEPTQIVTALHPALVTEEVFSEANRVLEGRKRNMKFKDDKSDLYPLRGFLRCTKHNLSLSAGPSKGRYGIYHYYVCTVKNDRCRRYPIQIVHEKIEKELAKIQFSAKVVQTYRSVLEGLFKREDQDRLAAIAKTESEISAVTTKRTNLQELLLSKSIGIEEYRELLSPLDCKLFGLKKNLQDLREVTAPFQEYLNKHVPLLENLLSFYQKSNGMTKKKILSCIFSEKIHFDENGDATISYTTPISVLMNTRVVLEGSKTKKEVKIDLLPTLAPLIDETSSYFPLLNYEVLYRVYMYNHSNQGEIADLN